MHTPYPISPADLARAERHALRQAHTFTATLPFWADREQVEVEALAAVHYAAQRFQPEKGASFLSWANTVVHQRMLEEVRRQSPWTRLSRQLRRENLQAGLEPEGWMLPAISLALPADAADPAAGPLEEAVPAPDPWPAVEARLLMEQLLSHLEPRRREAVRRYYLNGEPDREIGEALGVSTTRAYQLRAQAMEAMRIAAAGGYTKRTEAVAKVAISAG